MPRGNPEDSRVSRPSNQSNHPSHDILRHKGRAWDFLLWKDAQPVEDKKGGLIAAKLVVYVGEENDEYGTFISPEAFRACSDWMNSGNRTERRYPANRGSCAISGRHIDGSRVCDGILTPHNQERFL